MTAAKAGAQSTEVPDDAPARAVPDYKPGPAPRDIRQEAAEEPARDDGHDPDAVRVPSTRETAESVRRAHRALAELKQRQAIDDRRAVDEARERDDELARWHTDDHSAGADGHGSDDAAAPDHDREQATEDTDYLDDIDEIDDAPVLEVTTSDDY